MASLQATRLRASWLWAFQLQASVARLQTPVVRCLVSRCPSQDASDVTSEYANGNFCLLLPWQQFCRVRQADRMRGHRTSPASKTLQETQKIELCMLRVAGEHVWRQETCRLALMSDPREPPESSSEGPSPLTILEQTGLSHTTTLRIVQAFRRQTCITRFLGARNGRGLHQEHPSARRATN